MRRKSEALKPNPAFAEGELVMAYAYFIDPGLPELVSTRPMVVMSSWWETHEWAWVYDLYDPQNERTHSSIIEGLIRSYK